MRRAEALYALVAQRKGNETGVAGVDWAQKALEVLEQTKANTIKVVFVVPCRCALFWYDDRQGAILINLNVLLARVLLPRVLRCPYIVDLYHLRTSH